MEGAPSRGRLAQAEAGEIRRGIRAILREREPAASVAAAQAEDFCVH